MEPDRGSVKRDIAAPAASRGLAVPAGVDDPPTLDRAAALDRLGGDEDLLAEISGLFLANAPRLLADLGRAVAAGDLAAVHQAAHALKGSAGYVGGQSTAAAAEVLERIGAAGDVAAAPAALAALTREVGRLSTALDPAHAPLAPSGGAAP